MPLIDICKRVLAETGWPVPSAIASNSDGTAQQIFAIANTELGQLSELFNWPHLEATHTFTTTAATMYPFPADFRVLAQQSLFDASQYYQLRGSMNIQDWYARRYGLLGNLSRTAFRMAYPLGVPSVELSTVTAGRDFVALYQSSQYARNVGGASVPLYLADGDTSKIPERYVELGVKWRFRRAKGLDFSVELAEYNATVRTQFAKYMSQAEIPIGGQYAISDLDPGYVRANGFGA